MSKIFPFSFYLYLKLFVFNQPSWAAKLNSNVTFFLYFALKPDPLILICQSQPSVPQAILKNCARDWSISTILNHEPLHVLKRTVTLLNGFQPLGLQIKEGVLQLANQGGSTSPWKIRGSTLACKSRPTYIYSNVTFERSGMENCTNRLCENALQIHAVQIYAVQYIFCKYMECNIFSANT